MAIVDIVVSIVMGRDTRYGRHTIDSAAGLVNRAGRFW